MSLIVLAALVIAAAIWFVRGRGALNSNEKTYLRSRGYEDGADLPLLSDVPEDIRILDLLESLQDVTPYSRERAAEELSLMCESGKRDPRMFAPLVTALEDSSATVRGAVALALGNLADQRAVEHLKRVMESDESAHARAQARRALAKLGSDPAQAPGAPGS